MSAPEFTLAPPRAPLVLHGPHPTDQAVRDAMNAALAGDFNAVDHLERTYLNLLVRIGDLTVRDANGTPHWWFDPSGSRYSSLEDRGLAPFVVEYHRRHGASGEAALEWALMPVCRRCAGKLRRLECGICGGDWYTGEAWDASVITTVEGLILAADPFTEVVQLIDEEAASEWAPDWEAA